MLGREQFQDQPCGGGGDGGGGSSFGRKSYLRSVSWTDRSPRKPASRPQSNNKSRLGIPTLPPLSISKRTVEEWPRAGSDDLGVWPQAPTPGAKGPTKLPQSLGFEKLGGDFESKKDKLAFFAKDCSRIVDHVYLGSDAVAKNREVLRENGITHVLNCVGFVCPEYFKDEFVYKTLWLRDCPTEDITSILYDVFDYFEDVREQGGRVLVHCCQGVSRSTSLVIAYLMWREKQSFDDAFQYVKAARGVTNPNMGFACQLLLCQNRAMATMESPSSVLRMYRVAPHSPYDPLHLVPKLLSKPGIQALDSRGAFVVHTPVAVYVWIGKDCVPVMSDSAQVAAHQVIRYEMAQGPVVTVKEGEVPITFMEALSSKQFLSETTEQENMPDDDDKLSTRFEISEKKVDCYDQDFEIFYKALEGGVVPLFPLSGTGSETCLPARGNGWGRLRRKFSSGVFKEFIMSSKLFSDNVLSNSASDTVSHPSLLPSSGSASMDFSFCCPNSSPNKVKEQSNPIIDPVCSPTHSCSSQDSFSSYLIDSPKSNSKSPSYSPTTSDYSSFFAFSPSSSKWSDLSCLSSQTSPSGLESPPLHATHDNHSLQCKEISPHLDFSRDPTPSVARRRGSNFVPLTVQPSSDEESRVSKTLGRSWSLSLTHMEKGDVPKDIENFHREEDGGFKLKREDSSIDFDMLDARDEQSHSEVHGVGR